MKPIYELDKQLSSSISSPMSLILEKDELTSHVNEPASAAVAATVDSNPKI